MKKTISEIKFDREIIFKIFSESDILKYSLKNPDYYWNRFPDNKQLIGFRPILSVTKPDIISDLAERYYRAGSDIIVLETGQANRYYLKKYGISEVAYDLNYNYAKLVREKATKYSNITREQVRFVAGEVTGVPENEDINIIYSEQYKALYAAKVDMILFNNFDSVEQTLGAIDILEALMKNRKKETEIIISNKSEEYLFAIKKLLVGKNYSSINLIGLCSETEMGIDSNKHYFNSVIIDLPLNIELEEIKEFVEINKFKLIGFRKNVSPEIIDKIKKVAN